jgi:hypothetical protein
MKNLLVKGKPGPYIPGWGSPSRDVIVMPAHFP